MEENSESESLPAQDRKGKKGYELKIQEYAVSEFFSDSPTDGSNGSFLRDHAGYLNNFHTEVFHPPELPF